MSAELLVVEHLDGSRSALFPLGLREAVHLAALFHENLQIFELGNDSETEYFTFSSSPVTVSTLSGSGMTGAKSTSGSYSSG